MATVKQLLDFKGRDIISVGPEDTVYRAIELMAERQIGAVLVIESGKLLGLLSERDYARKVILKGKSSKDTRARDIMTTDLVCVSSDTDVEYCLGLMTTLRIRHLPVLDHGKLVGIVTIGDAVRQVISDKEFTIQQLEQYIVRG